MAAFTFNAGANAFIGLAPNDTFTLTAAAHFGADDFALGGAGIDTFVFSGTGFLILDDRIDEIEIVRLTNAGAAGVDASETLMALQIIGGAGTNILQGGFLNDTLTGGAGSDTLVGGGGNDLFLYASAAEMTPTEIVEGGQGYDVVRFSGTGTLVLGNDVQIEAIELAGATSGVDASLADSGLGIFGSAGANTIAGSAFDDELFGGNGNDLFIIKSGAHHGEFELIDGGAGVNTIRFASTLGTDTLLLSANVTGIRDIVLAGTSNINVEATDVGYGLLLAGNVAGNTLYGTQFNDTIEGADGADELFGDEGDDLFLIASLAHFDAGEAIDGGGNAGSGDTVRFTGTAGQTIVLADVTDVERVELAGTAATGANASSWTSGVEMLGNGANNTLVGGQGNDNFTGGAGSDSLVGGDGNDHFYFAKPTDLPAAERLNGGAGDDTLWYTGTTAITLKLAAGQLTDVETLRMTGSHNSNVDASLHAAAIDILGNDGANRITGGAGGDYLFGGDGNDTFLIVNPAHHTAAESIDGGNGIDQIHFQNAQAGQILSLGANVSEVERAAVTSTIAGGLDASALAYGLELAGNKAANIVIGSAFDDTISGGAGADLLAGGDGNDLFVFNTAAELPGAEAVNGGAGDDTLRFIAAGTYNAGAGVTNVEYFEAAAGSAAIHIKVTSNDDAWLTGNAGKNSLTGGGGDDYLNGGAGIDTLAGGNGEDWFYVDAAADLPAAEVVKGEDGFDTLFFTSTTEGETLVLGANVSGIEEIVLGNDDFDPSGTTALSIDASPQTGALQISGNDGDNTITGGSAGDLLIGFAGDDLLAGMSGGDLLVGLDGDDTLTGGAGDDMLAGGAGEDLLRGGLGNDLFVIEDVDTEIESGDQMHGGSGTEDAIALFGAGDTLDLSAFNMGDLTGIEIIDLFGLGAGDDNTLQLTPEDLVTHGFEVLRVDGDAGDVIQTGFGWIEGTSGELGYRLYTHENAPGRTLLVAQEVEFRLVDDLASMMGTASGLAIAGAAMFDQLGTASAGGDFDGDGYADLLVGAPYHGQADPVFPGAAFVVYGDTNFALPASVDLAAPGNGAETLAGIGTDRAGIGVAAAGDVNGDGIDDLIVGTWTSASIVFGDADGFDSVELFSMDGTDGFRVTGTNAGGDQPFGERVGSAGDLNGDGFGDFFVGAPNVTVGGQTNAGQLFVVYGKESFGPTLDSTTLGASDGFRIEGSSADAAIGSAVAAGDFNGDGIDDLVVGSPGADGGAGRAFVVFGRAAGFGTSLDLATLSGADGFSIDGIDVFYAELGHAVAAAGDLNGDGYEDFALSAVYAETDSGGQEAGKVYVVFGHGSVPGASFDLATLNGSNGFVLEGGVQEANVGTAVTGAGDLDGDGLDDLVVTDYSGELFVVFGQTSWGAEPINLHNLSASQGFRFTANPDMESVRAAGDVNGDGFDDLVIGASSASPNGQSSGEAYVFFGRDFRGQANFSSIDDSGELWPYDVDTNAAAAGANQIVMGAGNDSASGGGSNDTLLGGQGHDTLSGGADNDRLEGGANDDVLIGDLGDDRLFGDAGNDVLVGGAGSDTLTGGLGDDTFLFSSLDAPDRIQDFQGAGTAGGDILLFNPLAFASIASGVDSEFLVFGDGTAVLEADDFLRYDSSTGSLYYDADGSDSGSSAVLVVLLANKPSIDHGDMLVQPI